CGLLKPLRQLRVQLLPAPLGPISARISLRPMSIDMSESAVTPPNRRVTPRASISGVCAPGRASGSAIAVQLLDPGPVDAAVGPLRQRRHELDPPRPLEARDALADKIGKLVPGQAEALTQHAHRLDRLAAQAVGHPDHRDLGDGLMRRYRLLDLDRIDVLAARLDQLLGGGAALVPEIAVLVEGAEIAGMVPAAAQRELGIAAPAPIAEEDAGRAHDDLAGPAGRQRPV